MKFIYLLYFSDSSSLDQLDPDILYVLTRLLKIHEKRKQSQVWKIHSEPILALKKPWLEMKKETRHIHPSPLIIFLASHVMFQELLPLYKQQMHGEEEGRTLFRRSHHSNHHIRRPALSPHRWIPQRRRRWCWTDHCSRSCRLCKPVYNSSSSSVSSTFGLPVLLSASPVSSTN